MWSANAQAQKKNETTRTDEQFYRYFVYNASDNNHWVQFKHFAHFSLSFCTCFFLLLYYISQFSFVHSLFYASFFVHLNSYSLFHDVITVLHVRQGFLIFASCILVFSSMVCIDQVGELSFSFIVCNMHACIQMPRADECGYNCSETFYHFKIRSDLKDII